MLVALQITSHQIADRMELAADLIYLHCCLVRCHRVRVLRTPCALNALRARSRTPCAACVLLLLLLLPPSFSRRARGSSRACSGLRRLGCRPSPSSEEEHVRHLTLLPLRHWHSGGRRGTCNHASEPHTRCRSDRPAGELIHRRLRDHKRRWLPSCGTEFCLQAQRQVCLGAGSGSDCRRRSSR